MLTGKYRRNQEAPAGTRLASRPGSITPADYDVVEALEKYAAERGVTILDVAIGGLAARPAVSSVIAGATRPEQVRANAAAGSWVPSGEDMAALEAVLAGVGAGRLGPLTGGSPLSQSKSRKVALNCRAPRQRRSPRQRTEN